jgi:hypothetical protein
VTADRIHAELDQIIESRSDAVRVSDHVSIGVLERRRVNLVDHALLPPGRESTEILVRLRQHAFTIFQTK